ncbi:hypothetical protein [Tenacibaculum sp. 190524A02b]|uniref:hypothetical protein n=1 Tax=Tenacibaculum vairaonense TaxID=3137860 RepID=UPI0031FB1A36
MNRINKIISVWFYVVFLGRKKYSGYYYREFKIGDYFFDYREEYKMINNKTNKVIYRKGSYNGNLDHSMSKFEDFRFFL